MAWKAVIMAGGEGSRLRPLTCKKPKPLVPVAGKPAMSHGIALLAKYNIQEAAVTTRYLAEKISSYYGDSYENVHLHYFEEKTPLGTAGSVKNAEHFLDTDFIVISGDAVCDFDLKKAIAFHEKVHAEVTILLSHKPNPLEYGVVLCGKDGKIQRFIEKPAWSQAFSDTVNTGIYLINREILQDIPPDVPYDFSKNLFKKLLAQKRRLYGYVAEGYWCDIGDVDTFYRCNMEVSPEQNFVLGKNCTIGNNVKINHSVIFDHVTIGDDCTIDGAILCDGVKMGAHCMVREGCVIGEDTIVEEDVSFAKGVKIWNDKYIYGGKKIMETLIFGEMRRDLFEDSGILGDRATGLDTPFCVKLGGALSAATKQGRIGILHDGKSSSMLIQEAFFCGIHASGAKGYDFGCGFASLAAYTAIHYQLDLLLYVRELPDGQSQITLYDSNGLYPLRSFERTLEGALAREDGAKAQKIVPITKIDGVSFLYSSELIQSATHSLKGMQVSINQSEPAKIVAKVLTELGAEIQENAALMLQIDELGEDICILENRNSYKYTADKWHIAALLEEAEIKNGMKTIFLPYTAPDALEKIALEKGITVAKYLRCPADADENEIRAKVRSQIWLKDACFAAIKICCYLQEKQMSVAELVQSIPQFYHHLEDMNVDSQYKAVILRELYAEKTDGVKVQEEGICLPFENGAHVHVIAKRKGGFQMIAEAENEEFAKEIAAISKKKIIEMMELQKHGK